ncbi:hypothetical protein SBP02_15140 [Pseudomonas benzenivorans]|uniref:Uncharacterized protein n=1 Tax=Pseudomonas benzenivorans TaxID=556533 RepID=A0ABZ0PT80_9PSED|nr:hypothetical protein [Pseudomonas benzenivorans]WPC04099.1 hypothetical protein SBP02_15140 [Pseudomonas benzenivorans]
MTQIFYLPGNYESPLTSKGRARTIAAFELCLPNSTLVKGKPMRRDILRSLASPRAISYWLEQGWLEKCGKAGKVELLALTSKGLVTCQNAIAGGSEVPTSRELVDQCITEMTAGALGFKPKTFESINE